MNEDMGNTQFRHSSEPRWTPEDVKIWHTKLLYPETATETGFMLWHWMIPPRRSFPNDAQVEKFLAYAQKNPDLRYALRRLDGPEACLAAVFTRLWLHVRNKNRVQEREREYEEVDEHVQTLRSIKDQLQAFILKMNTLYSYAFDQCDPICDIYASAPHAGDVGERAVYERERIYKIRQMFLDIIEQIEHSERLFWNELKPPLETEEHDRFSLGLIHHCVKAMTADSITGKQGDHRWAAIATVLNGIARVLGYEEDFDRDNLEDNFDYLIETRAHFEKQWDDHIQKQRIDSHIMLVQEMYDAGEEFPSSNPWSKHFCPEVDPATGRIYWPDGRYPHRYESKGKIALVLFRVERKIVALAERLSALFQRKAS